MSKKIFITGGSGFLGRHLIKKLKDNKDFNISYPSSKEIDLLNYEDLKSVKNSFDYIFHLAAWTQAGDFCLKNPGLQWIKNQKINTNIIQWWQENQKDAKLIFIGTSCCYDENSSHSEINYLSDKPHESLYTYAMTKKMLTVGAMSCEKQFGFKWFSPVPSTLYGTDYHTDGRQEHFIFDLIRKILVGKKYNKEVVLWGDGEQRREIIHVNDFVSNMLKLNDKIDNQIINIGAASDYSIKEFANIICKIVDFDHKKIIYDINKYTGAKKKKLNTEIIENIIPNYKESLVNIETGLRESIDWCSNFIKK